MSDDGVGSDPLGDLTREVRERREERDDDAFAGAFESVEMESVDRETLWEDLFEEGEEESETSESATVATVETADDRDVRIVSNRLCHGCEFFARPPEMACTHEGTEIIERVDSEEFCVADCPMVEKPGIGDDPGRP